MGVKCSGKIEQVTVMGRCGLGSLFKQEVGTLQAWLPFLVKREDRSLGSEKKLGK